jgi:catechol 2,3-dioxygenase-like lactoylglutathione lyase family enzyme
MTSTAEGPVISLMLAVPDTAAAVEWYKRALGARGLCAALTHAAIGRYNTPLGGALA